MVGATLFASALVAGPAMAQDAPTPIAFGNITPGQNISGVAGISLDLQNSTTTPVESVLLTFRATGAAYSTQTVTQVAVPADCTSTCVLTASVDTTKVLPLDGAVSVPAVPDGSYILRAVAASTAGDSVAVATVVVDNGRASVAFPGEATAWSPTTPLGISGDSALTVRADAATGANAPAGTTITAVRLVVPAQPLIPVSDLTPSGDGTTWTTTLDTSAVPAGVYPAEAVALDSNGTVGDPSPITLVVDHGLQLTLPSGTLPDRTLGDSNLGYTYGTTALGCGSGAQYAAPQEITVKLDGTLWSTASATADGKPLNCVLSLAGTNTSARPLPLGHHTLTVTVADNRGHTTTASSHVTVALPLHVAWQGTAAKGYVILGLDQFVNLSAVATAQDGFSKLASWTLIDHSSYGTSYTSGHYPQMPSWPGWGEAVPETDTIQLLATSDSGVLTQSDLTIHVVPLTSVSLHLSTTKVHQGSTVAFTARVTERKTLSTLKWNTLDRATAELQFLPRGGKAWTTKATAITNATGTAVFRQKATRAGSWRVVLVASFSFAGSASAPTGLQVVS